MKRREFIAGLGAAAAWPVVARAQQAATPVIGILHQSTWNDSRRPMIDAFKRGLAEFGYIEGRNVVIEYRWAEVHYDRLPALAADLVRKQVSVIVTLGGTPAAVAAKTATQAIPIVFQIGANPLEYGLVANLARPGGNVTGFTMIANEVIAKRLDLLHQLVPAASSIAFLFNPSNLSNETEEVQTAARILGVRVLMKGAVHPSDIEPAFAEMARERAGAVIVSADSLFFANVDQVAVLAVRQGLPALFVNREAVSAGGLMSYGTSLPALYRQVGAYAGRIIKGEKPTDLPVQQPTTFEFVINLKTARALGLEIPPTLLALTDEVIE
jgi:putative tryptophan/tyrosine transport system substrate-binding protein